MRRQLLLLLLFSAAAAAQVTLEGYVTGKSTGQPLPGVRVAAMCDQVYWAVTDAAGHYYFTGLPAVTCNLVLDGPGLLPRNQLVTIKPQDTHITVRVAMTPQAAIAGKVVDENGWPVRAAVTAAQYQTDNGARQLQPVRTVQSNDLGRYRIGKLPPGRYYIRIRPMGNVPWGDYLPAWYPSAADMADARAIDLREGQEFSVADIHLTPGGGVEVRGRVVLPAGFQPGQGYLTVTWEELRATPAPGESVPIAPDGSFTMRHVPPRKYTLTATTSNVTDNSAPPKYSALRTIMVAGDNIEGITLNVAPTVMRDLKGTVVCEGGARPEQVHIALQRRNGNLRLMAKVETDGSFVIPGVWPGQYMGSASAESGRVTSVQFGGQEILSREFDFDGTEAPLRVTVLGEGSLGPIVGTVTDANRRPVAGASVIFVPSGAAYEPSRLKIRLPASTDQNGEFKAWPVPPGVYRAYVVEDPAETDQAMGDSDFLKSQESAFPPVTVLAGEDPPLKLVLPSK